MYHVAPHLPHACDAPLTLSLETKEPARRMDQAAIDDLHLADGRHVLLDGKLWGCWGCGRTHYCVDPTDHDYDPDFASFNDMTDVSDDACLPVLNEEFVYVCAFSGRILDAIAPDYSDAAGYQDGQDMEESTDRLCLSNAASFVVTLASRPLGIIDPHQVAPPISLMS